MSRVAREKAAKTGPLPVDILLDIARFHHAKAMLARAKRPQKLADGTPDPSSAIDIENEIRSEHAMAVTAADKAAPYYHPKLATLQASRPPDPTATSLEQMLVAMTNLAANDDVPMIEGTVTEVDAAE